MGDFDFADDNRILADCCLVVGYLDVKTAPKVMIVAYAAAVRLCVLIKQPCCYNFFIHFIIVYVVNRYLWFSVGGCFIGLGGDKQDMVCVTYFHVVFYCCVRDV